jgi:uncharacterized membrane protein YbhN (UPF0104 family)
MRRHAVTILKISVTLAGLVFILIQVEPAAILQNLVNSDPGWLLLTFLIFNASLVVRAFRWHLLLRGLGASVRFTRLVGLYFAGNFFNTFLPTSFGGDVVRAWEATADVSPAVSAGTVIVDRLTGLMALFMMALVALPFRPPDFPDDILLVTVLLAVVGLSAGVLLLEGSLFRRIGRRWAVFSPEGDGIVGRVLRTVNACGWRSVGMALLVSVAFNFMLAGWWWTAARSLGLEIPYTYLLLVIPILSVVLLIPSIGGLGPSEVVAPAVFAGAGVTPADAYTLSLLVFLVQRLSGLLGGLWYLRSTVRAGRWRAIPASAEKEPDLTTGDHPVGR